MAYVEGIYYGRTERINLILENLLPKTVKKTDRRGEWGAKCWDMPMMGNFRQLQTVW